MRCDMCQMNGIIRNMVCDDCEGGRNFDKIFEVPKLTQQGN